jgi:signal transduction histidine kinase
VGNGTLAGGVLTTVRDHGPGVAPENRGKIFDRFFTARPAGAPAGAGLGLSVVDTMARAHGARVEVGDAPGGGALFSLQLPRV